MINYMNNEWISPNPVIGWIRKISIYETKNVNQDEMKKKEIQLVKQRYIFIF